MDDFETALAAVVEDIRTRFSDKHSARERALQLSREVIRHCANSIRAMHRGEEERAKELQAEARLLLSDIEEALKGHRDIFYVGYVQDAQKEYAEAVIMRTVITGQPLPTPRELGVDDAPYLNGMGEAAGELRRALLDVLRKGDLPRCEYFLSVMDDIYSFLVTVDYPDAITGGLRRTTDMVRGVVERSRGDLTVAARQRDLEARLLEFESRLGGGNSGESRP